MSMRLAVPSARGADHQDLRPVSGLLGTDQRQQVVVDDGRHTVRNSSCVFIAVMHSGIAGQTGQPREYLGHSNSARAGMQKPLESGPKRA